VPIVDPGEQSPVFYSSDEILEYARFLINDMQGGTTGQILRDDDPRTWVVLNFCYGRLANWLEDNNVESAMYAEAVIGLPASASYTDPSSQSRLGYDGFVDAAGNYYQPSPALPSMLLEPLQMWQRRTNVVEPFYPMNQRLGGLGSTYNYGWNGGTYGSIYGDWEYRENSIYLLGGAYQPTEIRLRYIPSLAKLAMPTDQQTKPPIIWFAKAGECLSLWIAYHDVKSRMGANAAAGLKVDLDEEKNILANRSAKRENRTQTRRQGYGFARRRRCR
jgi:hypothetical protein